jgi:hypothetical protein
MSEHQWKRDSEHAAVCQVDEEKIVRFRKALTGLKERNKALSEEQRLLGLQRKPSRGATNKSRDNAIAVPAILNVARRLKGQPLTYRPTMKCRCCGHVREKPPQFVHSYPSSDYEMGVVEEVEAELWRELGLAEFIEKVTK